MRRHSRESSIYGIFHERSIARALPYRSISFYSVFKERNGTEVERVLYIERQPSKMEISIHFHIIILSCVVYTLRPVQFLVVQLSTLLIIHEHTCTYTCTCMPPTLVYPLSCTCKSCMHVCVCSQCYMYHLYFRLPLIQCDGANLGDMDTKIPGRETKHTLIANYIHTNRPQSCTKRCRVNAFLHHIERISQRHILTCYPRH